VEASAATASPASDEVALDLLFGTVVLSALFMTGRLTASAGRAAMIERTQARRLAAQPVADVAQRAVVTERHRLVADIEAVVRTSVQQMGASAAMAADAWHDDPRPQLRQIQDLGRRATDELRRLLGLLRDDRPELPVVATPANRPQRRFDLLFAGCTALLAVTEHIVWNTMDGWPHPGTTGVPSALFTASAAATVALRRSAPSVGAALCGLIVIGAAALAHPVSSGFWIILTAGGLAWAAMRRLTWSDTAGTLVLLVGTGAAIAWRDRPNTELDLLVVAVGGVAGAAVGWADLRRAGARAEATGRAAELTAAAAAAVRAERIEVARELHDMLSHAVGVMVVQAAAAELLLPSDRGRARSALAVVVTVAEDALVELDRLVTVIRGAPDASPPGAAVHDTTDLRALLARMRAAGLTIDVRMTGGPVDGDCGAAVYRIVQEALTNALRHAPGARVAVAVSAGANGTRVEITDDGPGPDGPLQRGYGLSGIAERVQQLGGRLAAGARSDGPGFRVDARLPGAAADVTARLPGAAADVTGRLPAPRPT
jgi:signal transduction histidine kinase